MQAILQKEGISMSFAQTLKKRFSFGGADGGRSPKAAKGSANAAGGSGKKLPRIPTPEEERHMSNTLKMKNTSDTHQNTSDTTHEQNLTNIPEHAPNQAASPTCNQHIQSYGQFFLEYQIAAEYNYLKKQRLPGVYVIPSFSNPSVWFGVIFIRQGIYRDGVFRFTIQIPVTYPDGECPTVTFSPPVFHPSVNPTTGELDLTKAFNAWRPNHNHIWQILLYMRRIFYKIEHEQPVNQEAAELYTSDLEAYKQKVIDSVTTISDGLYQDDVHQDDQHGIKFREWDEEVHGPIRKMLFEGNTEPSSTSKMIEQNSRVLDFEKPSLSGLSFIEPGTTLIFSKES